MLLPVLQECFAPSRRKRDFELRLSRLEADLLDVRQQMQRLVAEVQRFATLMSCDDKVSMRLIRANGVPQLAWQFHALRSGLWQNGRHGPMQVLMPVEALDDANGLRCVLRLLSVRMMLSCAGFVSRKRYASA